MEIVYDETSLETYLEKATLIEPGRPVLVDRFLDDALEIDVDALYDGKELYLAGIMEHIEEAGIHSGDSACSLPPITLGQSEIERIKTSTEAIAKGVGVLGLINIQFALAAGVLYVLEANPRASRTVPFVSKATAVQLAKAAARIAMGQTIAELRKIGMLPKTGDATVSLPGAPVAVKEAVLPFGRFQGVDTVLGPEMKSTGEVMGIDKTFGVAFAKSQIAALGEGLPASGKVFVSVADRDKRTMIFPIKRLADLGFELYATSGTADVLQRNGVKAIAVRKQSEGPGPNGEPTIVQMILNDEIDLVINTPHGTGSRQDGYEIRTAAVLRGVPSVTTVSGLGAAVQGIESAMTHEMTVHPLQEYALAIKAARES
jgi:carbamoyl-phosphate synthase large subunit